MEQFGQQLGHGLGKGLSGKTLKSMFNDVLEAGGSPLTAMQRVMPYDPDLAEKLGNAEMKKRGQETLRDLVLQMKPEWAGMVSGDTDPFVMLQAATELESLASAREAAGREAGFREREIGIKEAEQARKALETLSGGTEEESPFTMDMTGSQLKSMFPNDTRVQGLADETVYPVRRTGNRLIGVGSMKPPAPTKERPEWEIGQAHRKEFEALPEVRQANEILTKYDVMTEAVKESRDPSTQNYVGIDQAIITLFNKMTDPSSVVRESEYARTPGDLSVLNRLKGKVEKLKGGGPGLTQEDREAIYRMGTKFYRVYQKKLKDRIKQYRSIMKNAGADPDIWLSPIAPEIGGTTDDLSDAAQFDRTGQ